MWMRTWRRRLVMHQSTTAQSSSTCKVCGAAMLCSGDLTSSILTFI